MNGRRNYWFVLVAMTVGMLTVAFGLLPFLPALTVLAVAVIAANWRQFKLSRQEVVYIAIVAAVLMVLLPLVWSLVGRKSFSGKRKAESPDSTLSAGIAIQKKLSLAKPRVSQPGSRPPGLQSE